MRFAIIFCTLAILPTTASFADEIIVQSVNLPGASLDQEVTYHPNKADYIKARNARLKKLKEGDASAMANPANGPWMIVQTTAKIGIAYKGIGVSKGRKHLRRITAAEDALYEYENRK